MGEDEKLLWREIPCRTFQKINSACWNSKWNCVTCGRCDGCKKKMRKKQSARGCDGGLVRKDLSFMGEKMATATWLGVASPTDRRDGKHEGVNGGKARPNGC